VDFTRESLKRYTEPYEEEIVEKQADFQPNGRRVNVAGFKTDIGTVSGMKRVQDGS
jgi:hypothetical protein